MKIEIMIAVLGIICIGALAAVFVLWAKVDELKQKTAEEHECYEAMLRLHNGVAVRAQELQAKNGALESDVATLNHCLNTELDYVDELIDKNRDMQDRLSALLCPMNDHVWKDGVCVKCGRMKDA